MVEICVKSTIRGKTIGYRHNLEDNMFSKLTNFCLVNLQFVKSNDFQSVENVD